MPRFIFCAAALISPTVANEQHEELFDWLRTIGIPKEMADDTAEKVCQGWPEAEAHERRQKASHYLQLLNNWDIRNSSMDDAYEYGDGEELEDEAEVEARRLVGRGAHCANLGHALNKKCKKTVLWSQQDGRWGEEAPVWYADMKRFTGMEYKEASIEDYQKFYYCGLHEPVRKCGLPPCSCTYPPCDICRAGKKEDRGKKMVQPTAKDLGLERQCKANAGCMDVDGDCCPGKDGKMKACCGFIAPQVLGELPTHFDAYPKIPEEDEKLALDDGRFLGPLENTICRTPGPSTTVREPVLVSQCSAMCEKGTNCDVFTWKPIKKSDKGHCKLYAKTPTRCRPVWDDEGTKLYVKNTGGLSPHWVPPIKVNAKEAQFFGIGDWGSLCCPARASMHYMTPREPGSDLWLVDHHAQEEVAKVMNQLAKVQKPFLVVNVGDNFYWGGIPHKKRKGRHVHDHVWNLGFENVYNEEELFVPWLGVTGNHDYGGDGCFSDIRAQFDYTIKDLLQGDRWKMPSPYFNHIVEMDGFNIEFFMVDSNFEDSHNGRHGGICAQYLCPQYVEEGEDDKMIDEKICQTWFSDLLKNQNAWIDETFAKSTAEWKILGIHHKPMGFIDAALMPRAVKHGIHLMIAGHTHETSVHDKWPKYGKNQIPMVVIGQGGGAQGNPGCGGAVFCGSATDYSFANFGINKNFVTITLHRYDEITLHTSYLARDGGDGKSKLTIEKQDGAPEPPTPLKAGGPAPSARPKPRPRPVPRAPGNWKPLVKKDVQKKSAWDTEGDCACDQSGSPNGIATSGRIGCARHMRSMPIFCYIAGDKSCKGAKFSRTMKLWYRRCTPDENSMTV